jgi:hypothetical protein
MAFYNQKYKIFQFFWVFHIVLLEVDELDIFGPLFCMLFL